MGKSTTMRCVSCHKVIDAASQFCKHCGARIKKLPRESKCPKCGKMIESVATYCIHCGFNLQRPHAQGTSAALRILKYFVSVLLVILILIIFFTILYKQEERRTQQEPVVKESFLDITSLTCEEAQQNFKICGRFSWKGIAGDFVTVHVPGAAAEESESFTEEVFDYCSNAGAAEGFHVVRMILHNSNGGVVDEVGRGVECKKQQAPAPRRVPGREVTTIVNKHGQFRAERTTTYNRGFGTAALVFPGKVEECSYEGTYTVDDRPILRKQGRCHNAGGTFKGEADARRQHLVNDPGLFAWDYKVKTDPDPYSIEGYLFAMRPCEISYSQSDADMNFARAQLSGFGSTILTVSWEFKDITEGRAVDALFDLRCKVRTSAP